MPTHDHPEAMEAAALTAEIIYRLRMGESIEAMYVLLNERYQIPALKDIRPVTEFDFTCNTTLPIAFAAFYEAAVKVEILTDKGYGAVQEAVKNAISLGGDTDTNAAITAAFAEAWIDAWTFSETDGVFKHERPWYDNEFRWQYQWAETEAYLTLDIISVVRRMDEAVARINPIRVCGEYVYRTDDRGEAVILKYPCSEAGWEKFSRDCNGMVRVPSSLDGHPVTAIGPFAFQMRYIGREFKPGWIIPDSVRSVGDHAFNGVRQVILPDCVEVIGVRAFARYNSVGDKLPEKLKVLGACAFEEVKLYPELPPNLERIGKKAFTQYKGWDGRWNSGKCVIPKSVKSMDHEALRIPAQTVCWVYRDSEGERYFQARGERFYYADPEDAAAEEVRYAKDETERERRLEESRRQNELRTQAEMEEYECVEVSVQRYAGWREHAEQAGYVIDSLDRDSRNDANKKGSIRTPPGAAFFEQSDKMKRSEPLSKF